LVQRATRLAMAMAAIAAPLAAQTPGTAPGPVARNDYVVQGTVVGLAAAPVANAEVVVSAGTRSPRRLQTDSVGRFAITGLGEPTIALHVRAFGYSPKTSSISITSPDHRASVTIVLDPLAAELTTAEITAAGADADRKLVEYYTRKSSNGFGRFIDEAQIEKQKPRVVSEMLRSMPGVTLDPSGRIGNIVRIRGCSPLVWVDGVRMPGAQLDEVAPVADVAGIEIYNSFAGIPARYFDRSATCGTILVWLKP
jgi:hypothetical protein